jgi:hypothetical protein
MALRLTDRYWASKPRTLRLLDEIRDAGWCRRTVYIPPAGDGPHTHRDKPNSPEASWLDDVDQVAEQSGPSETGLGVFLGEDRAVAVLPPFPLSQYTGRPGTHVAPLVDLLASQIVSGVVLLRLGRYAAGVLRGDQLIASKTGTRHVKSRHRAGGSSQRRFERSRERLVRELFDKTCEVARAVLSPYEAEIDYVLTGGERHTLGRFVKRCRYLRDLGPRTLGRVLQIDRPGQRALDGVASQVWKSRVLVFETDAEG